MAIIWNDEMKSHTIKRRGAVIETIMLERFKDDPRNDRAVEAQIKHDIESKADNANRGCTALIHLFNRDPINYTLRIAPRGYGPLPNWWELPIQQKTTGAKDDKSL